MKAFLSYCHEDTSYKDQFISFVGHQLETLGVELWHDREMLAGDYLDPEIQKNLEEADMIFFLISQPFINSFYCYQKEMMAAISRHNSNNCRLFPIVIRPCLWSETPISKYVIYGDAKPFSQSTNQDEAWVEISKEAKRAVNQHRKNLATKPLKRKEKTSGASQNEEITKYIDSLNKTEIKLINKNLEVSNLDAFFVWPDLKLISIDPGKSDILTESKKIATHPNSISKRITIVGKEQIGKTALAKMICIESNKKNQCIYFSSSEIYGKNIKEKIIEKSERVNGYHSSESTIIIDDFDKIKGNNKYKEKVAESVFEISERSIFIVSEESAAADHLLRESESSAIFEIFPLNKNLRSILIEKWHTYAREYEIEEKELEALHDRSEQRIENFLIGNTVPARPLYLLMILQMEDSAQPLDLHQTSYGHCYQKIIVQYLERAGCGSENLEDCINYLSELSHFMFSSETHLLSEIEYKKFEKQYEDNFFFSPETKDTLVRSGIVSFNGENYSISYKYIYYYCCARKISDDFENKNLADLEMLCNKIHIEQYANILIFVTHHTRNNEIVDLITLKIMEIFDSDNEAEFSKNDFSHLDDISKEIPELVLKQKTAREERKKLRSQQSKDEISTLENSDCGSIQNEEKEYREVPEQVRLSRQAYRAVEVIGQILRNRKGSLKKEKLVQLADEGVSVGLRFIGNYLNLTKDLREEIIQQIESLLSDKEVTPDNQLLESSARRYFWALCYLMSFSVIKRISETLGGDQVIPIFDEVTKERKKSDKYSIARALCDISMKMHHTKKIPQDMINDALKRIDGNLVTKRLLQEAVVQHIYLNTTSHEEKSWVASKLSIPVKEQQLMQNKSRRINQ